MVFVTSISRTLGVACVLVSSVLALCSQDKVYPSGTAIAIIPVVNTSGDKWQDLKDKQAERAITFLTDEFKKRNFKVVDPAEVASAISAAKVDLTDEENWKRDSLYDIGSKAGATLVLFVVITDTGQHKSANFLSTTVEGWVQLKTWLVDATLRSGIISAKTVKGSSKHSEVIFGTVTGSKLQVIAVGNGLRDVLKDFFKPYPANSGGVMP